MASNGPGLLSLIKISWRLLDVYDAESCFSAVLIAVRFLRFGEEFKATAAVAAHWVCFLMLDIISLISFGWTDSRPWKTCCRPREKHTLSPFSLRNLLFGDYTETTMAIEVCNCAVFSSVTTACRVVNMQTGFRWGFSSLGWLETPAII